MAYDKGLAARIEEIMIDIKNVIPKKMLGGIALFLPPKQGNNFPYDQNYEIIKKTLLFFNSLSFRTNKTNFLTHFTGNKLPYLIPRNRALMTTVKFVYFFSNFTRNT